MLYKRISILILVASVLTNIWINLTHAQELSVSEVWGESGKIVEVSLAISQNSNVASVDAIVRISNSNAAEFVISDQLTGEAAVTGGSALNADQTAFGNFQPDGTLRVIVINSNPNVDPTPFNNGVIADIALEITGRGAGPELGLQRVECADDLAVVVPCDIRN